MNKNNNFFKKIKENYWSDAKILGIKWIDLIKKDTREKSINTINEYKKFKKDAISKLNKRVKKQKSNFLRAADS